ncbi:hypothetical protein CEXT_758321 [Caerostris extrusa]|uniref:Uncharacterized protein n=1 Tax=Caerostris extrusa TaxID=172846 RepID=A0AAV4Y609_CAEEX|nr:hypothetical protein CEXT_758321 [Caerostris extrusa]
MRKQKASPVSMLVDFFFSCAVNIRARKDVLLVVKVEPPRPLFGDDPRLLAWYCLRFRKITQPDIVDLRIEKLLLKSAPMPGVLG